MLTVHHLGVSQSDRIVWLCEELGLPYRLVRYERDPVTHLAPADYKALHPSGTAPVITDDTLVLAESGAIIDYIVAKHGDGRLALGAADANFAEYRYWFHFANSSMMASAMIAVVIPLVGGNTESDIARLFSNRLDLTFDLVEQRLGDVDYFAGDEFTAADIMMLFPLTTMRLSAPRDLSPYPNILAYLQRIGARPAYRRAAEKADPNLIPQLT